MSKYAQPEFGSRTDALQYSPRVSTLFMSLSFVLAGLAGALIASLPASAALCTLAMLAAVGIIICDWTMQHSKREARRAAILARLEE